MCSFGTPLRTDSMMDSLVKAVLCWFSILVCRYSTEVSGFLLDDVTLSCSSEVKFTLRAFPRPILNNTFYSIALNDPRLVSRIVFNLESCSSFNRAASTNISMTYTDASDVTETPRNYSSSFSGVVDPDDISVFYELKPPIYVGSMAIVTTRAFDCAAIHVQGCEPSAVCKVNQCLNGGTCTGINSCACAAGHFGETCEDRIEDLTVEKFEFLGIDNGVLHTSSGDLCLSGNVTLVQALPSNLGQSATSGYLSFQGSGGTCSTEQTQTTSKRTLGLLAGLSNVFGNLLHHGFSHTSTLHFWQHHNHNHGIYLFNTHHNWNPNLIGASLWYHNHRLRFKVNNGRAVFRLKVNWSPKYSVPYILTSSYSIDHGLSLFANGLHLGSVAKPYTHHSHGFPRGHRLCFGSHCRVFPHLPGTANPVASYMMSQVQAVATSAVSLAVNGLAGLVGLSFPNNTTRSATTITATTTTTTTTTAPSTTNSATTAASAVFTATAQSQTSSFQLLCYSCNHMGTDGACFTPQMCNPGEVCALYHDPKGYTHRCLDATVCSNAKAVVGKRCWECCTSSLCNQRCAPAVLCNDTSQCALLQSTGYSVCSDPHLAKTDCKKTCGNCSTSG